jgi:hypothetical protein
MLNISHFKNYDFISRHYYDDRLYSQIMRHFLSFFISKILGKSHIHWPYQNEEINNNFLKLFDKSIIIDKEDTFDNIMNMVYYKKSGITVPDQDLVSPFDINDIFSDENIEIMRKAYKYIGHTSTFDPNAQINVAVHIRRGDISNMPYCDRYTDLEYFNKYIKIIAQIIPTAHFHIYSDSIVNLDIIGIYNIFYHYSDDLLSSVYDMIHSDIFIMSVGSNMSYFAGLLSKGIVFFDETKLEKCFNNMYNIYWSDYKRFIYKHEDFISKLKSLTTD